ncbi:MAG: hypothetical protein GY777_30735 [Candidatus Brocadiaceae bacterium]|nr:hypothetical protein [Candidatus Brocadiaceae bacterium]
MKFVSLIIIAILSAITWRIELEIHGWTGLIWLRYFHWAVPFGILLFIIWAIYWSAITPYFRRMKFGLCLVAGAPVLCWITIVALTSVFLGGPSGFVMWASRGPILGYILMFSIFLIWPLIPVINWGILRIFRPDLSLRTLLFSVSSFILAIPFGLLTLRLIHDFTYHKGGIDLIHTVKSGTIIPWLVIALGLPYMQRRDR